MTWIFNHFNLLFEELSPLHQHLGGSHVSLRGLWLVTRRTVEAAVVVGGRTQGVAHHHHQIVTIDKEFRERRWRRPTSETAQESEAKDDSFDD